MATREQVHLMQTAQPFRPFLVKLADGRSFTVTHPELVSCSLDSQEMVLDDEGGTHLIEMSMVNELAAAPAPAAGTTEKPKANWRRPGEEPS